MSKNARKILAVLLIIVLAVLLSFAIPSVCLTPITGASVQVAMADDQPQATEEGELTEVPVIEKNSFIYSCNPYEINTDLYALVKIENSDGEAVENAIDAGEYTVYVTPTENHVWEGEGGTTVKSFTLTINKSTLNWCYPREEDSVDSPYMEEAYSEQRKNFINNVWAYGEQSTYNNNKFEKFIIIKDGNAETPIKSNVIDAGTYTFSVPDYYNYENPSFTLKINPKEVDIGNHNNLQWVTDSFSPKGLVTGNVYSYYYNRRDSEETEEAYTNLRVGNSPYSNWENWRENKANDTYVADGIVSYRENSTCKIKLNRDSGSMAYFSAVYSGVTSAGSSGKYTAEALISPVPNYVMTYTPSPSGSSQNMTIEQLDNGTYKITKTWYVVHCLNEFIAETSFDSKAKDEYSFPEELSFGQFPENGISAPCLAHGDEVRMWEQLPDGYAQPNGYSLDADGVRVLEISGETVVYADGAEDWKEGINDLVTFTIISNDDNSTVCVNEPRSKLGYYVNGYMPSGSYTITFKAKTVGLGGIHIEWWNGMTGTNCGSEYLGITLEFEFEVKPATLNYDDAALNFFNQAFTPYEINIDALANNYNQFFGVTDGKISWNAITNADVAATDTYWATVADAYYGAAPVLKYRLEGVGGGEYYYQTAPEWHDWINKPDSYRVYYSVNMQNYESVPAVENYGQKYFTVNVYEELDLPSLVMYNLNWTGEPRSVTPTVTDYRYVISDTVQTDRGDYKAVFTISDPVKYHWRGVEGAVYKLDWSIIDKPANSWKTDRSPKIIGWKWHGFDNAVNLVQATATDGAPVFSVTSDEAGKEVVNGLEAFTADGSDRVTEAIGNLLNALPAGAYYLWATVEETATYAELKPTAYKFTVELADNSWTEEPVISNWKVGDSPAIPTAETVKALFGTPEFKIVSEFDDKEVYYDTANNTDRVLSMTAGRYIFIATVAATTDSYGGIRTELPLLVFAEQSDEDWVILPSITDWVAGKTPSEPQGMSVVARSTVTFAYYTRDGEPLESRPEDAGEYTMEAIAYAEDGSEIVRKTVDFTVKRDTSGVTIALCCVLGVLVCTLGIMLAIYFVKRKRAKGGSNGNGGNAPEGGNDGGSGDEPKPEEPRPEEPISEEAQPEESAQTEAVAPIEEQSPVEEDTAEGIPVEEGNTEEQPVEELEPEEDTTVEEAEEPTEEEQLEEVEELTEEAEPEVEQAVEERQAPDGEEVGNEHLDELEEAEAEETQSDEVEEQTEEVQAEEVDEQLEGEQPEADGHTDSGEDEEE